MTAPPSGFHLGDPVMLKKVGDLVVSNLVWVFHGGGDADRDLASGRVHIDATDLPLKQQTRKVYRVLSAALATIGLDGAHVVHQRVHLRDLHDYGRWLRILRDEFGDWRPATTVFGEGAGLLPGIEIAVEIIASTTARPDLIDVEQAAASTDPFPGAVRAGDWIFTSSISAMTPDGDAVMKMADLNIFGEVPRVPDLEGQGRYGEREGVLVAQMLAIYSNMKLIVEAAGGHMDALAKQNGYSRLHMKSFTPIEAARRAVFRDQTTVPAATTVQVADLGQNDKIRFQFEAVGVAQNVSREAMMASGETKPYAFYAPVVRVGDVVFTAGELAYSSEIGGVVGAWENDSGRALVHQARFVARRLRGLFSVAGVSPEGIARLNVYLRDRSHFHAWARLTLEELVGASPTIVETTVLDAGPYESCLFEVDAIGEAARL